MHVEPKPCIDSVTIYPRAGLPAVVRGAVVHLRGTSDAPKLTVAGPPGLYAYLVTAFRLSGIRDLFDNADIHVYEFVQAGGPPGGRVARNPLTYGDPNEGVGAIEGIRRTYLEPDEDGFWTVPATQSEVRTNHSAVRMRAGRIKHTFDSFGFVAVENTRRRIDVERARALGLRPGPKFRLLTAGESIEAEDGRVITADEVTNVVPGRRLAYLGDTFDPMGAAGLVAGADVLVHEATFLGDTPDKAATAKLHSTTRMAGRFARDLGVGSLFLNHFREASFSGGARPTIQQMRREGKGKNWRQNPMPIVPAEDFMVVKVLEDRNVEVHGSEYLADILRREKEPFIEVDQGRQIRGRNL
uniref:Uncharacterized protein n=1 Tax=Phaeomonas parva TaxID=124430 RepID=A0A7S1TWM9_9STRA|mmetsp:Transcript_21185/g.64523  ORF Transcript_21185/g.64523 Transcript_21185/m.64523 type:complete len:356 (+) Transcript_21185:371-1438(+)